MASRSTRPYLRELLHAVAAEPALLGLGFLHMWIYCSTHRPVPTGAPSLMVVMYVALFVLLSAMVLGALAHRSAQSRATDIADACCALLMGASGAGLALAMDLPLAVFNVSAVLGGAGMGWAYARWCQVYARADVHVAVPLVFLTMAAGSVGKTLVDLMPAIPAAICLALLPAASLLCARHNLTRPKSITLEAADGAPEPAADIYFNRRTAGSLLRIGAGVAVYSLAIGLTQALLLDNASVGIVALLTHHLGEVFISLLIVVWVAVARRGLDFCGTWRLIAVLIATALLFEPFLAAPAASANMLSLVRTAQTFLIIFLFVALANVARHSGLGARTVFAAGWAAYALPFALGKLAGDCLIQLGAASNMVTSAMVWALVVVMLFVLDSSSLGNRLIFAELNDEADQDTLAARMGQLQRELTRSDDQRAQSPDSLSAASDTLAAKHRLTPREREILELLARGRTKAHIAEAFFISENTVRNHVKHIYAKLDVHDRQELIDRVEEAGRS